MEGNEKIDVLLDIVMNIMEKDGKTILHEAAEKGITMIFRRVFKPNWLKRSIN